MSYRMTCLNRKYPMLLESLGRRGRRNKHARFYCVSPVLPAIEHSCIALMRPNFFPACAKRLLRGRFLFERPNRPSGTKWKMAPNRQISSRLHDVPQWNEGSAACWCQLAWVAQHLNASYRQYAKYVGWLEYVCAQRSKFCPCAWFGCIRKKQTNDRRAYQFGCMPKWCWFALGTNTYPKRK